MDFIFPHGLQKIENLKELAELWPGWREFKPPEHRPLENWPPEYRPPEDWPPRK